MPDLHSLLSVGYTNDRDKQIKFAKDNNLKRDDELSNSKHQFYTSQDGKQLYHNINGTQNNNIHDAVRDWGTNAMIALGRGKNTQRYKEEKGALEKAKAKHNPESTTITGHSQAKFHADNISNQGDTVVTYNGVGTLGKNNSATNYRTSSDPVSILGVGKKHTVNVKSAPSTINFSKKPSLFHSNLFNVGKSLVNSHSLNHLEGKNISV